MTWKITVIRYNTELEGALSRTTPIRACSNISFLKTQIRIILNWIGKEYRGHSYLSFLKTQIRIVLNWIGKKYWGGVGCENTGNNISEHFQCAFFYYYFIGRGGNLMCNVSNLSKLKKNSRITLCINPIFDTLLKTTKTYLRRLSHHLSNGLTWNVKFRARLFRTILDFSVWRK